VSGQSDYLELKLLDHVLGATVYTAPATVYLALYSVTPGDAGGGTELSGNGYARVAVTNNATNWPAAAAGAKSNGAAVVFPTATPSNWTAAVAFGILDNSSGGNLLYWGPLTESVTILANETPQFNIGDIIVTED